MKRNLLLVEFRCRWENVMQNMLLASRREWSGSSSKFVQGSKKYQLSSVKDHDALKPHAVAKMANADFDARKARLSVPPRKVVQQLPSGSAIAKSIPQMNDKDQETATKLHDIAYYIALHGLPLTQLEHHIHLEK